MKHPTSARDPKTFHKLQDLVREIEIAMITTLTPDGALHSRPMATRKFDDDGNIWFFTADDSGKAHDLSLEQGVNVSYADPKQQRYVSVSGVGTVVHDRKKAAELWHPMVAAYFPRGLEDPRLALLRVRVEVAEYWDSTKSKMVQLFEMTKAAVLGETPDLGEHAKVDMRAGQASG